ncbi:hypothetical protein EYF80_034759 [Liparis tanakae]|uniref:Uncharacterized protein n=1 Tax=Liparis tanakae TaxID=230148 RepID=A0A4Z2GQK6_9TELE|nr:hypothetical protein EYF80_034759 [Liparis tanakae]
MATGPVTLSIDPGIKMRNNEREFNYAVSPIQWEVSEKCQQLSLGSRVGVLLKVTVAGGRFPSVELETGFIVKDGVTIPKAPLIPDG